MVNKDNQSDGVTLEGLPLKNGVPRFIVHYNAQHSVSKVVNYIENQIERLEKSEKPGYEREIEALYCINDGISELLMKQSIFNDIEHTLNVLIYNRSKLEIEYADKTRELKLNQHDQHDKELCNRLDNEICDIMLKHVEVDDKIHTLNTLKNNIDQSKDLVDRLMITVNDVRHLIEHSGPESDMKHFRDEFGLINESGLNE